MYCVYKRYGSLVVGVSHSKGASVQLRYGAKSQQMILIIRLILYSDIL